MSFFTKVGAWAVSTGLVGAIRVTAEIVLPMVGIKIPPGLTSVVGPVTVIGGATAATAAGLGEMLDASFKECCVKEERKACSFSSALKLLVPAIPFVIGATMEAGIAISTCMQSSNNTDCLNNIDMHLGHPGNYTQGNYTFDHQGNSTSTSYLSSGMGIGLPFLTAAVGVVGLAAGAVIDKCCGKPHHDNYEELDEDLSINRHTP